MLISKNINPLNSVYFIGSKLIEYLNTVKIKKINFFDLYLELNKSNKISLQLFILSIDWLFLLEIIKIDKDGIILKCF